MLATRYGFVKDNLISTNQSTFLNEKMLVDEVVAVNEGIYSTKRLKKVCLIFMVDFEEAYDFVSWSFLDYMLTSFCFIEKWMA